MHLECVTDLTEELWTETNYNTFVCGYMYRYIHTVQKHQGETEL